MGLEGENLQSGLYGDASPRPEAKHRVGGVSSDSAAAVLNSIRRRPDCLAEDADRSETVSRPGADPPAICDLQGVFQKLQGEPILLPAKFPNSFKILERLLPDLRSREHFLVLQGRSREHFWYCREQR
jgi:hypothetical protein